MLSKEKNNERLSNWAIKQPVSSVNKIWANSEKWKGTVVFNWYTSIWIYWFICHTCVYPFTWNVDQKMNINDILVKQIENFYCLSKFL